MARFIPPNPTHPFQLKRHLSMLIAIGCCEVAYGQTTTPLFDDGDLPASPWSSKVIRQTSNTEFRIGPPSSSSKSDPSTTKRPAKVSLMGPVALSENQKNSPLIPMRDSIEVFESVEPVEITLPSTPRPFTLRPESSSAAPKHTQTQNPLVDAQSDQQRVRAGGFDHPITELDSAFTSESPVKTEPAHLSGPANPSHQSRSMTASTRMASSTAVVPSGPITFKSSDAPILESTRRPESPSDAFEAQRMALAKRISFELTSESPYPPARAPEYLEAPLGWGAVEHELHERLEKCDALLKRNAFHSARDEATQGLRRLCRTMDAHRRSLHSSPALEKAFTALREEGDFHQVHQSEVVQTLINSHSTEALKGRPLDHISPEIASQHYRTFARYQLVVAADGHPWSADLLYAFGKSLEKEGDLDSARSVSLRNQAVACYQAAMQVAPNQTEVANQLGYTLITLDRIDEAYAALSNSLAQKQTSSAWNNMAEIYRRRGAASSAEYAVQQANAVTSQQPQYSHENPLVTEVDPTTFARYSPMPLQTPSASNGPSQATTSATQATRQSSASSNFFTKMFKR